MAVLTSHHTCTGQTCQPFWSGLIPQHPLMSLNQKSFVFYDDGTGSSMFMSRVTGPFRVRRWMPSGWVDLGARGLTHDQMYSLWSSQIGTFDDGIGVSLYAYSPAGAARWTGARWVPMPAGFTDANGTAPLGSFDFGDGMRIYGSHIQPGAPAIAWWDGTEWVDFGRTSNGTATRALVRLDEPSGPVLYAFGGFREIEGQTCRGIAKWDGHTWSSPCPEWGIAMLAGGRFTVFDDGNGPAIYTNHQIGREGSPACEVSRWDGHEWTCFGNGTRPPFTIGTINVLQVFDDGRGPALYIAGSFDAFAGHTAKNIIRWDGSTWEAFPNNLEFAWHSGIVDDVRGRSMFIAYGGTPINVGGGVVDQAVLWTGCINQCYPDCDRSGGLDINDFVCFINKYAALDPYANCTVDAVIDINDFACFVGKFAQGCP